MKKKLFYLCTNYHVLYFKQQMFYFYTFLITYFYVTKRWKSAQNSWLFSDSHIVWNHAYVRLIVGYPHKCGLDLHRWDPHMLGSHSHIHISWVWVLTNMGAAHSGPGGGIFPKSYFRIFSLFSFTFKLELWWSNIKKNYEKIFIRSDFTNIFITQKSEIFNQTFGRKYL